MLYVLGGLVALLVILALLVGTRKPKFAPKPLLTKNEIEFYGRLRKAVPEFALFSQVALRAIVKPGSPSGNRRYWRELALIGSKHCDFLVCHPDTLDVIAIIELDDRSHDKSRDDARDRMTAAAGHRTLRFESRNRPSVQELRAAILNGQEGIQWNSR